MSAPTANELSRRLARMRSPSSNGDGAPATEDLDWFLFQSFPECAVPPAKFAELVPVYARALRTGARFDYELLFVRVLELHDLVGSEGIRSVAHAAVARAFGGGFDPADAVAALRFALRALPADDGFLDDMLSRADLASLRFQWTLDFVLDEREPADYLTLSYLRDDDPATASLLEAFPIAPGRARTVAAFLADEECRARLEAGWETETSTEERAALAAALREKLPGFSADAPRHAPGAIPPATRGPGAGRLPGAAASPERPSSSSP